MGLSSDAVYGALHAEIDKRMDLRQALAVTNLTAAFTLFALSFQGWIASVVLLCFPFLSFFLACLFEQHDQRIGQLQAYLTEIEQGGYWESWRRGKFKRNKLISLASRGLFVASQGLALIIGLSRWQGQIVEWIVLPLAVVASIGTVLVLKHWRG